MLSNSPFSLKIIVFKRPHSRDRVCGFTPVSRVPVVSCWVGYLAAAAAAKSLQSCPTLWDPIDGSPPGSPVPGMLQARTLEWVAISFSSAWKWKVKVKSLRRVRLFEIPWTVSYPVPPAMGFSRQEYWSGVPSPSLVIWLSFLVIKWKWW